MDEVTRLKNVIAALSDVLEAHAVHGDHSDECLQYWADQGRKAIDDYPEDME